MNKQDFVCWNCDEEFSVESHSEEQPKFCPFCGEYMDDEVEDDEPLDWE